MNGVGAEPRIWKCARCSRELVPRKTTLTYMEYAVDHEVLTCPTCGKVYVSRELAEGRMAEFEQLLEDK